MKLKNDIILGLVQAGCLNLTTTNLDASQSYKCIKFRRAIHKAFESLQKSEREMIAECNLEIGENGILVGKDEDKDRFGKLRAELNGDTTDIGDIKTIPYVAWHELKRENRGLANALLEDSLEGVLWESPEE